MTLQHNSALSPARNTAVGEGEKKKNRKRMANFAQKEALSIEDTGDTLIAMKGY